MPWYRKHGKILKPMTPEIFAKCMTSGRFAQEEHKAYAVIVYYSAVRKWEALRSLKNQFVITDSTVFFDVGPRLKKIRRSRKGKRISDKKYQEIFERRKNAITTPPLPLPLDAPFMDELVKRIEAAEHQQEPIFPWSPKTAYNIMDRAFGAYPHYCRLSRITWFFMPHPEVGRPRGFSIPEVRSFTGLSLAALDYYIGLADVSDMGRAMYLEQKTNNSATLEGVNT